MKRAKLKWPVAQVREDGTPAIWLTHRNWLLLQDGIVRAFVERRAWLGAYRARQEWRYKLGDNWRKNIILDQRSVTDEWPNYERNAEAAMELFIAGFEAWKHNMTPEKLAEIGNHAEATAFADQTKQIEASEAQRNGAPSAQ